MGQSRGLRTVLFAFLSRTLPSCGTSEPNLTRVVGKPLHLSSFVPFVVMPLGVDYEFDVNHN